MDTNYGPFIFIVVGVGIALIGLGTARLLRKSVHKQMPGRGDQSNVGIVAGPAGSSEGGGWFGGDDDCAGGDGGGDGGGD